MGGVLYSGGMRYLILILIAVSIVGLLLISPTIAYMTDTHVTFTVEEKERIVTGTGDSLRSKYLVFTDSGVYQNTDTIWYWKWRSSDLQGEMKVGETYTAHVYGFRFGFLSLYKNIISVEKVEE